MNQRDKNKRFIGVWVQLDVKQALQSIAKKMNIPLSQLVANALKDLIKRG